MCYLGGPIAESNYQIPYDDKSGLRFIAKMEIMELHSVYEEYREWFNTSYRSYPDDIIGNRAFLDVALSVRKDFPDDVMWQTSDGILTFDEFKLNYFQLFSQKT